MKLKMNEEDAKKLFLIKKMHNLDSLEDAFVWALRKVTIRESSLDMAAFQLDLDKIPSIRSGEGPQMVPDEQTTSRDASWHGIEIKLGKL